MNFKNASAKLCPLLITATISSSALNAEDWPQWGGHPDRNFASSAKGIPATFEPGERATDSREIDMATTKNVKWAASLGTQTYGNPTVAGGKVFVGTNSAAIRDPELRQDKGGAVLCFDEKTGKRLWELHVPRFKTDIKVFNFDNIDLGICSSATVEGNRVYVVSSRCELLCLDVNGQANGNDGPFKDEAKFIAGSDNPPAKLSPTDGDIIWCVDMITHPDVNCWPQDAADCSVVIIGDLVYCSPSNGVDRTHKNIPRPDAPMLIAVNKRTGEVVARDNADIGWRLLHGTWSAPSLGKVNGKTLIFFGGPDGYCYALDPTPVKEPGKKLATLKVVWKCDANAPHCRERNGVKLAYRAKDENKYGDGPSECIATPVFHKGRVYVDVGQDPRHGKGYGNLVCIDPGKTGDITKTGIIWSYDKLDRSLATVSIWNDLLFVADFSGKVHCLDLKTGKPHWVFDTESPIWSSTFVVDGKVFIGTEQQNLYVFAASKEQKLLNKIKLHDKSYTTPIVANGVLYVTSQSQLWAITKDGK